MKQATFINIGVLAMLYLLVAAFTSLPPFGKEARPAEITPPTTPDATVVTPVTPLGVKLACDVADNKNDVKVAVSNTPNTSIDYRVSTIALVIGDTIVDTDTSTGGTTLSWKVLDVDCADRSGLVIAKTTATVGGGSKAFTIAPERTSIEVLVVGANASANLSKSILSNTYANVSNPTNNYGGNLTEFSSTAMGKGDTRSGYIDVKMANSYAVYGGSESKIDAKYTAYGGDAGMVDVGGILWGIDTISSSVFSDSSGFSLSVSSGGLQLTEVSCSRFPNEQAKYSLNRCWTSKAIGQGKSTGLAAANAISGDNRLAVSIFADLGDPSAADDPKLYMIPINWYEDKTEDRSVYLYGGVDSNSAYIGLEPNAFAFDNS